MDIATGIGTGQTAMYHAGLFDAYRKATAGRAYISGKGMKVTADEQKAWHPSIAVYYFQTNVWADTAFTVE